VETVPAVGVNNGPAPTKPETKVDAPTKPEIKEEKIVLEPLAVGSDLPVGVPQFMLDAYSVSGMEEVPEEHITKASIAAAGPVAAFGTAERLADPVNAAYAHPADYALVGLLLEKLYYLTYGKADCTVPTEAKGMMVGLETKTMTQEQFNKAADQVHLASYYFKHLAESCSASETEEIEDPNTQEKSIRPISNEHKPPKGMVKLIYNHGLEAMKQVLALCADLESYSTLQTGNIKREGKNPRNGVTYTCNSVRKLQPAMVSFTQYINDVEKQPQPQQA